MTLKNIPVHGIKGEAPDRVAEHAEGRVPSDEIQLDVTAFGRRTGLQNDLFRSKAPGLHHVLQRKAGENGPKSLVPKVPASTHQDVLDDVTVWKMT